jgi:hypothetical protein
MVSKLISFILYLPSSHAHFNCLIVVPVLCIVPAERAAFPIDDATKENMPEPELYILEGESEGDIATGRHRDDGKYK